MIFFLDKNKSKNVYLNAHQQLDFYDKNQKLNKSQQHHLEYLYMVIFR